MFKFDIITAYTFKILRDAYMMVDDDISKSLAEKMEQGLEKRLHGRPIRLVYDRNMPDDVLELLAAKLRLNKEAKLNPGGRYHMMRDLMDFPSVLPDLEEYSPEPLRHPDISPSTSLLKAVTKRDVLLHYPYHTFNHVIDFLREAAIDYRVESIFITLYRTASHSKIINALVNAARNGKHVTVLFEVRARFDEEQNLENAELLQKEGVRVIHGVGGLKVHSKIILVERKERGIKKGYAYIGTGNFNESTAKIYSDLGLLTKDQEIVEDVRSVCQFLALSKPIENRHILTSPFNMRETLKSLIEKEISNAEKGKPASIRVKCNSLTDPKMVKLLYRASESGVDVDLIVRGACCLQPGVEGQSSRIRVISIVDKYLEHARISIFHNGGDEKVYIMSADLMTRNLDRRVEVGTPIYDKRIKETLKDLFEIQWRDNVKARDLKNFGANDYVRDGKKSLRSQTRLYEYYKSKGKDRK
jgi:polyphosphate kinase